MNKLKNTTLFTLFAAALIASNSSLLAHDDSLDYTHTHENDHHHAAPAQAHATHPETNHHQSHHGTTNPNNVSVVIQNNHSAKRDVALTRIVWAVIKNGIGGTLLTAGTPTAIASPFAICAGIAGGSPSMTAGASVAFMVSFPLAYAGYKLVQSGLNTIRDELVESAGLK